MTETLTTNEQALLANAYTLRRELLQKILDETRDMDTECGYPLNISIGDYQTFFKRHGIANRVNKIMPEECWNVTPEIVESESENESVFEKEWKALVKEFHIFQYFSRLDILTGIGRYGALLVGINDNKKLNEPVEGIDLKTGKGSKRKTKRTLLYLKPLSEAMLTINKKVTDVTSPRFGLPELYSLKLENVEGAIAGDEILIHWTRVIHVAENKGCSEVFGVPRMEPMWNFLLDIKKLLGGSAEMFWRGAYPGMAFEVNPERKTALTTTEATALREEFDNYSNKLQRYMALVGVTAKSLAVQVASPKDHFDVILKAIGITLGIPYRLLVGSEEAKLASSTDTATWHRRVKKRQESFCTTEIVEAFINRLIAFGVLTEPKEYDVQWPDLTELDPKDKAIVMKDKTEALSKYVGGGCQVMIPPFQFLTLVMGFDDDVATKFIEEAEDFNDDAINEEEIETEEPEKSTED